MQDQSWSCMNAEYQNKREGVGGGGGGAIIYTCFHEKPLLNSILACLEVSLR